MGFWRHAQVAHDLIAESWCCRCRSDHCADLALLQRPTAVVHLNVDFLFSRDVDATSAPLWGRFTTRISRNDKSRESQSNVQGRSVTFASSAGPAVQMTSLSHTQLSSVPTAQPTSLPQTVDLCRAMSVPKTADQRLGLLINQHSDDQYYVFLNGEPENDPDARTFTSLKSLLTTGPSQKPNRRQRFEIALILVSSHLQLHSGAWLESGWSSDHVFFAVENGKPRLEQPYLRRGFTSSTENAGFDVPFATLGIILLELCFGTTLAASPCRQQHLAPGGQTNVVQDREAAWEWAKDVVGETGQEYADAVDWCLGKWRVRKDDRMWREQYYRNVVETLQKAYELTWSA